ncbi:hypothetical protein [Methanothermobacter sp.]|uniref:hypothetical protein n=1 Tax=Methanothermobacter sp. TaxID=1884223 RepID=UPI003C712CCF
MRLVCMLTACMLLMNTAGYAVAADDTAFEVEEPLDQCFSLKENCSKELVDSGSNETFHGGSDQLGADKTEPPVSVDREGMKPLTTAQIKLEWQVQTW